jgi:hypothetical protein
MEERMPLELQHILVLLLVAACIAVIGVQAVRTLRGKKSKLGSCCAKGCEPPAESASPRGVHFMPVEMLRKRP